MSRSIEPEGKAGVRVPPGNPGRRVTTSLTLEPGSQSYHWVTDRKGRRTDKK